MVFCSIIHPYITKWLDLSGMLLSLVQAVSKVCHFMSTPSNDHQQAVKHILWYLKHTLSRGLFISKFSYLMLHTFFGADWAGCLYDRKYSGGYAIFLCDNLFS